jgi:hypothetical protein
MLNYLKLGGAALIVAALLYGGWAANGWRIRAAEAAVLKHELRAELQRRVRADADRLSLQVKLSEAEAKVGTGVKLVTRTIREYIHDTPDCRITSPAVINGLRDLRAGIVPAAPTQPAAGRAAP